MLTQSIKYLFTFFSATYFLLAGVGYNVVNYCCSSCAEVGIEEIAYRSCNEIHHHDHSKNADHQQDDIACANGNHHPDGCHLLRVKVDIPSVQAIQEISDTKINYIHLFYTFVNLLTEPDEFTHHNILLPPDLYVQSSGREILAFHAVLLI